MVVCWNFRLTLTIQALRDCFDFPCKMPSGNLEKIIYSLLKKFSCRTDPQRHLLGLIRIVWVMKCKNQLSCSTWETSTRKVPKAYTLHICSESGISTKLGRFWIINCAKFHVERWRRWNFTRCGVRNYMFPRESKVVVNAAVHYRACFVVCSAVRIC